MLTVYKNAQDIADTLATLAFEAASQSDPALKRAYTEILELSKTDPLRAAQLTRELANERARAQVNRTLEMLYLRRHADDLWQDTFEEVGNHELRIAESQVNEAGYEFVAVLSNLLFGLDEARHNYALAELGTNVRVKLTLDSRAVQAVNDQYILDGESPLGIGAVNGLYSLRTTFTLGSWDTVAAIDHYNRSGDAQQWRAGATNQLILMLGVRLASPQGVITPPHLQPFPTTPLPLITRPGSVSLITEAAAPNYANIAFARNLAHIERFGHRITPQLMGVRSIAENARLLRMWQDSMRELNAMKGRNGSALRTYLEAIERGETPSGSVARAAFDSVRQSFIRKVQAAIRSGESFPGYSFEQIHHWNWYLRDYSMHSIDPRNLYPVSRIVHNYLHWRLTSGRHPTYSPINPLHLQPLDSSFPFAPPFP